MQVKVKYFGVPEEYQLEQKAFGNWVDVRAIRLMINGESKDWAEDGSISYKKGDVVKIALGFAMQLPEGYEALVNPRSSTHKNYQLIQVNSQGVIDTTYCGDNDEWFAEYLATGEGKLHQYDRVGQFRIIESMPKIEFEVVETLGNNDRGGHGSTGVK